MAAKALPKQIVRGFSTARTRSYTPNPGESMTEQAFKDSCDVNKILKSFGVMQASPAYQAKLASAQYGYCPSDSYHEACNMALEAKSLFADLPSALRKRFNNDPGELLAFVESEDNYDEAVDIGLIELPDTPDQPVLEPKAPINPAETPAKDSSPT